VGLYTNNSLAHTLADQQHHSTSSQHSTQHHHHPQATTLCLKLKPVAQANTVTGYIRSQQSIKCGWGFDEKGYALSNQV